VIGEIPVGGTKVDKGSTVALTVSSGPASVSVPSVVGEPLAQAKRTITKAGLKIGRIVPESSQSIAAGSVIDTSPSAGQPVPAGSAITLVNSSGKPQAPVPDVTGDSESAARAAIVNAGFKVGSVTTQQTSSTPAGNVISQSPGGGTEATPGSTVDLVVAQAPPATVAVPGVTGKTAADATSALSGAGFTVSQTTKDVKDQAKNGIVLSQTPSGGTQAKKGSAVTIVVGKFTGGPTGPTGPASAGP
jgi:serine/threonine-protein kinase